MLKHSNSSLSERNGRMMTVPGEASYSKTSALETSVISGGSGDVSRPEKEEKEDKLVNHTAVEIPEPEPVTTSSIKPVESLKVKTKVKERKRLFGFSRTEMAILGVLILCLVLFSVLLIVTVQAKSDEEETEEYLGMIKESFVELLDLIESKIYDSDDSDEKA